LKLTDIFRKVDTLSADEARRWIDEKKEGEVTLIDVREPEEYKEGHLPGALLMPLSDLLDRMKELDIVKPVITYCRMGNRSKSAAALMKGQGFNRTYSIEGGITAWNGLVATGEYESGMFLLDERKTTEELISLACVLEDGTRQFYEKTQELLQDRDAKPVFESLITDEVKHKAMILEAYRKIKGIHITDEFLEKESLTGFMEGGVSIEEILMWLKAPDRTLQDVLELSMQVETNSLDLYIKMLHEIEDENAQKVFGVLIAEEKAHLSRLGKLLDNKLKMKNEQTI
jgi:rhodanese-related sulfurtransferase/rubrerythrin